ncbi:hypothetical protein ABT344_19070 [Micromonospora carbonacea]|uniref:hypothetical protein n=1 Tax=Micromonospora carbonacea TaxID=47853 RepID=UPI0033234A2B
MPFDARVIRVMIASPGDVTAERAIMREQCYRWNASHAEREATILLPLMWEYDSAPLLDPDGPQAVINKQLASRADLLVGVFWSRMGTATAEHESGSAEEITTMAGKGRPVLLYFSTRPLPADVDLDQVARLRAFRARMEKSGLVRVFESAEEFRNLTYDALTRVLHDHFSAGSGGTDAAAAEPPRDERPSTVVASLVLRPRGQHEEAFLVIENAGPNTVEDVRFTFATRYHPLMRPLVTHQEPIRALQPGTKATIALAGLPVSMLTGERIHQLEVTVTWFEQGQRHGTTQTVTAV